MNDNIKIFCETELDYQGKRKVIMDIMKIFEGKKLSLNQASELLDLTKEKLKEKPLWG